MVKVIELPDVCIVPCVIELQPVTPVGILVGVRVNVGVLVMVGVKVMVGVRVMVGVKDGVNVNSEVGVGVSVAVFVGEGATVLVGVAVPVGVLACQVEGGAVTAMDIDTRMVRALSPRMGSPLATERSIKGTKLGMIGKKSPSIFTLMRVVLAVDGITPRSTDPSHVSKGAVPGPLS